MGKNCHWALSAINYKNNDRITACPRGQGSLTRKSMTHKPSDIFNSYGFKKLRLDLERDEWPKHCDSCKVREEKSITSYREMQNEMFWHDDLRDNLNTLTGDAGYSNLEYVEFRFSNTCNFSCLHCSPEYSSTWADIVRKTEVTDLDHAMGITPLTIEAKNQNWTVEEAEEVASDLIMNFPNLRRMDVAGGEPLYQKQFWAFLRKIIEHPNIHNMDITVISNFNTMVDYKELAVLLDKFKTSTVRISVDGGSRIYNYFRTGDWDTLENNINVFKSLNKKTILEATCTISAYQILMFKESFYDMYFLNVDRLHNTFVQYPSYLDPSILKSRFFDKIQADLDHLMLFLNRQWDRNVKTDKTRSGFKIVDTVKDLFAKTETIEQDYQKFLYYIDRMDTIKNQNFDDHFRITKVDLKNATPKQ